MPKVLMLSLVYPPDVVSTAPVAREIALGLQSLGHEVTVLTSMPYYHVPKEAENKPHLQGSLWRPLSRTIEDGMRVIRVFMRKRSRVLWRRLFEFAWFKLVTMAGAILWCGRQDVVLVLSPPITLGIEGYFLARLCRGAMVYDVRELWPDAPVRMGLIKRPVFIKLVQAFERFVYQRAAAITVIARSFETALINRGVPAAKIFFTPNYGSADKFLGREKRNPLAQRLGIADKFVALYAGNIGLTQGLEDFIEVARRLRNRPDIVIVIVGDGAARAKLDQDIRESGLPNIRLVPYQPVELVPDLYAAADVCLIPLIQGFAQDTVPSKMLTILASGKPAIASVDLDSETALVINEAGSGRVVPPRGIDAIVQALEELHDNRDVRETMGRNGQRYLAEHFSFEGTLGTYDRVVRRLASRGRA